MAQDLTQHLVMAFIPVPRLAQTPAIDDVTDQEQVLAAGAVQKVGEEIAAGAARAKMRVGNKYAAVGRSHARGDRYVHARCSRYLGIPVDKVKFT
jgi:hypothetical protein